MLQVKIWGFTLKKPNGYTPEKMEKEVNKFMINHNCDVDSFEMFEMDGFMMIKVLYKTTKGKLKLRKKRDKL